MVTVAVIILMLMLPVIVGVVLYNVFVRSQRHVTRDPQRSTSPDPTWMLFPQATAPDSATAQDQSGGDRAGCHHPHHHHHPCDPGHSHVDVGGSHSVDTSSSSGCDIG